MQTKVTMLKGSEWSFNQWDGASETPVLQSEGNYHITVDAATHREAFRLAYYARFNVAPPEDRVRMLINYRIIKGEITFSVDDDYLPGECFPIHPPETEIISED